MTPSTPTRHQQNMFDRFLHSQVSSSLVLVLFTIIALLWANSPWSSQYFALAESKLGIGWDGLIYKHSLDHWIKDGLMAIFFFVVGLEIKREMVVGELSSLQRATLPISAAVGGALVPALIYAAFNAGTEGAAGWGIPMATDIAFALGLLALFGKRVPIGIKVFLTALAIADDMLAVAVIAFFYTAQLDLYAIAMAAVFLALLAGTARLGIRSSWVYLVLSIGVWVSLERSGIHATVAGVLIALLVPVKALIDPKHFFQVTKRNIALLESSRLTRESLNANPTQRRLVNEIEMAAGDITPPGIYLEKLLHPLTAFLILPLFALFAAGVAFEAGAMGAFPGKISMGIILGLFFGKQIGILLFSWLAIKIGGAKMPEGAAWLQLWGVSALAGIGFTMSIFITELAFTDPGRVAEAKIAIIIVSVVSGACGFLLLNKVLPKVE